MAQRQRWASHKVGPALRYVIGVHMRTGKYLWLSNAYRGGASEIGIVSEELFPHMGQNERLLADRLFRYSPRFITATGFDCEFTRQVNAIRSSVERQIRVLKHFRMFTTRCRSDDYEFHSRLLHVAARLIAFLQQ